MTTALRAPRRVTALLAGLGGAAVAGTGLAPGASLLRVPVIVRALRGQGARARQAVERPGGSVSRELGLIGGFAAQLPEAGVARVASAAGVRSVTPDPKVRLLDSGTYDGSTDPGSMYSTAGTTGLRSAWTAGFTGRGV